MDSVKISFTAPRALLQELQSELNKRGVKLKGGQKNELVEALKMRVAFLRGDLMRVYYDGKFALMDIKEITPEFLLECEDCSISDIESKKMCKKHLLYFAELMLKMAKKFGGKISLEVQDGNLFYLEEVPLDKLNPETLVENVKVKEGSGPHLYIGDYVEGSHVYRGNYVFSLCTFGFGGIKR